MCECKDIDLGSYGNQVSLPRPSHMMGKHNEDCNPSVICVDKCLSGEILYLWSKGISTTGCCCGHNKAPAFIGVEFEDIQRMKDMGYIVQFNRCRPLDSDSFLAKSI